MSTIVKTHGMDGHLTEPDWPPITQPELRILLARFEELREPIEILSVSPRPFSAACVVGTAGGRVFIKRHHRTVRDQGGLLEEHRFLEHLKASGARVPQVLHDRSGESAIEIGAWTYEVHEVPSGTDVYGEAHSWTPFRSVQHARSAGEALARLHVIARGYIAPPRKPQPLVSSFTIFAAPDPEMALQHFISVRPSLAGNTRVRATGDQALELLHPFHAELRPLLPELVPLWTHNDLHASNLLWTDSSDAAEAASIIDFGLADRTNAVHDLALAIERNIIEWLALTDRDATGESVPVHLDALAALLSGYESVRPLSPEEAAALAPMTALCHAEFALSEAEYFSGALHSQEKTGLALAYLVDHARWFRTSGGQQLLAAIRGHVGSREARR